MKIFHYSKLELDKGNPIFYFRTEDELRFKMYGKRKLVRLKFTYDRIYMEKKGLTRRFFKEILRDAETQFETLDEGLQSIDTPADRILFLQRTAGDQAVSRLMRIGQPWDVYEKEARVRRQVPISKISYSSRHWWRKILAGIC